MQIRINSSIKNKISRSTCRSSRRMQVIMGLILGLMLSILPIGLVEQQSVHAATSSGTCGTSATWNFDGNGTLTIGGSGKMDNYTYTYYEIGDVFYHGATTPWNQYKDKITNIIIGNQITRIGVYGFCGLSKLTAVNFPSSLTEIGEAAFFGCASLTSITIPETVTRIDRDAFNQCTGLKRASISGSIKTLSFMMFSGCKALDTVTIGSGITYIGAAFQGCSSLKNVTIPDTVVTIDSSAFKKCTSLESIVIPDSVKELGWYTFDGCSSLKSVTLSKNLRCVPYLTFNDCTSLTSIDIPDGVTDINEAAFQNCTSLVSVDLPQNLNWINNWAFKGCTSLKSITFPEKTTLVLQEAFMNCTALETINFSKNVGFQHNVFQNCTSLREVYIPKGVGVGSAMFMGCTNLTKVTIEEGFESVITNKMFSACVSLSTISIPEKSRTIGAQAFEGCTALKEVTLPDGVMQIWDKAFKDCTSLSTIRIPDTVGGLGKDAFLGCLSLKQVWMSKYTSTIDTHAFGFNDSYQKIPGFKMNCYEGSVGETYAKTNGLDYQSMKYDISQLKISLSSTDHLVYNGNEQKPYIVSVQFPTVAINPTLDKDYTIEYTDNINAGTVTIKAKGIGEYTGQTTTTYTIKKQVIPNNISISEQMYVYDGTQKKPSITVTSSSKIKLVEGKDYTAEYSDNIAPGTAKITIKGMGNYDKESFKTFVIKKADFKNISSEDTTITYDGSGHSVKVTIPEGANVLYSQTNGAFTAEKPTYKDVGNYSVFYKVIKDNYNDFSGSARITITSKSIGEMTVKLSFDSILYDGTEKKPNVSLAGLTEGVDYDISYLDTVRPGTASVTLVGRGNYTGSLKKTYEIKSPELSGVSTDDVRKTFDGNPTSINVTVPEGATIQYSSDGSTYFTENPRFTNAGEYKVYYKVSKINYIEFKGAAKVQISAKNLTGMLVALSETSYMYIGSAIKPVVHINDLKLGSDYNVAYQNNINPGKATVVITGNGNYNGELKTIFSIKVSVPVVSIKGSVGKTTVKWNKVKCTGYEIYKSNTANTKYTLINTVGSSVNSITINGKKGQTCYVKIRAFVKVNGKKVYGEFSYVSSAKIG